MGESEYTGQHDWALLELEKLQRAIRADSATIGGQETELAKLRDENKKLRDDLDVQYGLGAMGSARNYGDEFKKLRAQLVTARESCCELLTILGRRDGRIGDLDRELQRCAARLVPLERLREAAQRHYNAYGPAMTSGALVAALAACEPKPEPAKPPVERHFVCDCGTVYVPAHGFNPEGVRHNNVNLASQCEGIFRKCCGGPSVSV